MTSGPARLARALAVSWPPAATRRCGPFRLARSPGGGRRVNAAIRIGPAGADDIAAAEAAMCAEGRPPLFRVADDDPPLAGLLAARGYAVDAPTVFVVGAVAPLAARPVPPVTAFDVWPPLAIQRAIWAEAGHGPARLAVMDRAAGPKTALLGRVDDRPGGAGFLAAHGAIAVLNALEIRPAARRRGLAGHLVAHAASWAAARGCTHLAAAVTRDNAPARALYAALGMAETGGYHYRAAPDVPDG